MSLFTSSATWLVIANWVIVIGNAIVPVVPQTVSVIIGTIVTLCTLYVHNNQIKAGSVK